MLRRVKYIQTVLVVFGLIHPVLLVGQEQTPVPADHNLIYALDEKNNTIALPFETATTPLKSEQVAKSTTTSYIELKGEHSSTVLPAKTLIFVFTNDRGGAHPPLIVWLTPHGHTRRVTAIA